MDKNNHLITLISSDGKYFEVEKDLRHWSSTIRKMMKNKCIYKKGLYPVNVESDVLKDIIAWCVHKNFTPFRVAPSIDQSNPAKVGTSAVINQTMAPGVKSSMMTPTTLKSKATAHEVNIPPKTNNDGNKSNEKKSPNSRKKTIDKSTIDSNERKTVRISEMPERDNLILMKSSVRDEWEMNFLDVGMCRLRLYMIGARILGVRSLVQAITFKYAVLTMDKDDAGITTLLDLPKFHNEGNSLFKQVWDPEKNNFVSEKAKDFFTSYMYSTLCCDTKSGVCLSRDIDYDMYPTRVSSRVMEGSKVMFKVKNFFVDD